MNLILTSLRTSKYFTAFEVDNEVIVALSMGCPLVKRTRASWTCSFKSRCSDLSERTKLKFAEPPVLLTVEAATLLYREVPSFY